jgi:hypothetical protein
MLEPRPSPSGFKWRRTAFARIGGAIDIAENLAPADLRR